MSGKIAGTSALSVFVETRLPDINKFDLKMAHM